jgi:para-nitrobenzyl esterase
MSINVHRRRFLGSLSLITASLALPDFVYALPTLEDFVIAQTTYGKVRGINNKGVAVFRGIPYAGKVSGDRRFKRPAPLEKWSETRDALGPGAPAMQAPRKNEPAPAEDCLFLNIWTPATDKKKRPVMFYNHGGGFVLGSGTSKSQDGANLARNFDVVVVETNHRLGLLGYLYLDHLGGPAYAGSGNMGLLDITEALKWVHLNIASFGGDRDNVMIFGESGGGEKTSCLYAMEDAAPYFNKASIESGPGIRMRSKESAIATTALVLKELNIEEQDWVKLLDVSAAELLALQSRLLAKPLSPVIGSASISFSPVIDGVVLKHHPFDPAAPQISKNKPLMVGWNEDEFTFVAWESKDPSFVNLDFNGLKTRLEPQYGTNTTKIIETYRKSRPKASPADIFVAISSITMMGLGSIVIAERKAQQQGAPVYLYNFGYKTEVKVPGSNYALGTPHAMDISFKFNNEIPEAGPSFFGGNRPERFIASHHMAELWTKFAKTGRPAAKDVPDWPEYDLVARPTMRIDTTCEVFNNRFASEIALWKAIGKM